MLQEFFFEYFCEPIMNPSVQGYNLVNTGFYAIILFLAVFYFVAPFLKKQDIKIDFGFALAIIPFILFGAGLRVLNDIGIFQKTCNPFDINFFTFTPGIWIAVAGITIASLFIAKKLSKTSSEFNKKFGLIGLLFCLPILIFEIINFKAWGGFVMVLIIGVVLVVLTKIIAELRIKDFFKDKLNILVVAGQILDGTATFVATDIFNCGEQHPLSESILGVHPALFILIKILLALLIIYYIDRDVKDKRFATVIKLAVIILGFATGGRDLLTLAIGTCL